MFTIAPPAGSNDNPPPGALVRLERTIGLRVAHARDAGVVDPDKRKLYLEAQEYDGKGEQALRTGDYGEARSDFLHAGQLLDTLGM